MRDPDAAPRAHANEPLPSRPSPRPRPPAPPQAQAQRDELESRVDARRRQAESLRAGYARVAGQMGELHAVVAGWRADGLLPAAAAAGPGAM